MSIDQHVSVTLKVNSSGVVRSGYGLIGVVSYKNLFPERTRLYSKASDAVTDGFPSDSPEGLAIARILGQSPRAPKVAILRGTRPPTQKFTLSASAVRNLFKYKANVKGEGVTPTAVEYQSDAASTTQEIHDGMRTQLNAVVGKNYTANFSPLVVADFVFTATNADETLHKVAHGLETGDGPFQATNAGGGLPGGIAALTDYWIIRTGADTFMLATSLANALAGVFILLATDGTGVQTLSDKPETVRPKDPLLVTGNAPGNWFSIELLDTTALSIAQTHVDPGIAADLAEIQLADPSWYWLDTSFNSKDMVLAAAAWVEANDKVYVPQVNDNASENTVVAGATDTLAAIAPLGYKRTVGSYQRKLDQMFGAGWEGILAPKKPGSWTAAYKQIAGVSADRFTETQLANLDARRASYYKIEGPDGTGVSFTWEGKVGSLSYGFLDVTVSLDVVIDAIRKKVLGIKLALDKVAYTDEDIALMRSGIEGVIDEFKSDKYKMIAPGTPGEPNDPQPTVTFPRVKDIDPDARALRELPDGAVNFRLQGAVHKTFIDLTVSF